jgi:photosystem II reaction center protein PsbM
VGVSLYVVRSSLLTIVCSPSSLYPLVAKTVFKGAAAAVPVAALSAPAFAMDSVVDALPSIDLSMQVQFGGFLAVLLGTFLPALFLINLFISTETRKAGAEDALKGEDF